MFSYVVFVLKDTIFILFLFFIKRTFLCVCSHVIFACFVLIIVERGDRGCLLDTVTTFPCNVSRELDAKIIVHCL